ncbi:MAG: hypothetical protein MMC23_002625 [Stictis urceolatum]|nr:hypothetical protein [Stictis urceolata]
MDSGLVDLSLFAISPTNDPYFSLEDELPSSSLFGPAPGTLRNASTMKPLPPIPHRRLGAFSPDPRSNVANPTRTILERVKRMRVEPYIPSQPLPAIQTPQKSQQTLQQRRHPDSVTHTLTIPTPSHQSTPARGPVSAAAVSTSRPAAPMIWLAEEEMWLVADGMNTQTDLYGFYAPAPHTDPGPYGYYSPEDFDESPPAYSASPTSVPSSSDFSPVRSQFTSLLESQSSFDNSRLSSSPPDFVPTRVERSDTSPMFQEALSGMSFGMPYQGVGANWTREAGRRDSWHSDSGVSPMSSATETPTRHRIQRTASARQ